MKKLIDRFLAWLRKRADVPKVEPEPKPMPTPSPTPSPMPGDDLALAGVRWYGQNYAVAVRTATITDAQTEGHKLMTDYEPYQWPVKVVNEKPCDAIACLFYERDGEVVGGKYDWWRQGGQRVKGLENVHDGYGGHSMPSKGTPMWTMIVSVDGKLRSNTKRVRWI